MSVDEDGNVVGAVADPNAGANARFRLAYAMREFYDNVRASFVPGYGHAAGDAELEHAAPTGATAGRPLEMQAVVIRGAPLVSGEPYTCRSNA